MATQVDIRAPAEQTEGTRSQILRWLKSVGDRVTENEPLIEIETDKVTVEVASPGSGTLQAIFKAEQDEIQPGELLGRIEAGEAIAASDGKTAGSSGRDPTRAIDTGASQGSAGASRIADAAASDAATHLLSPAVRRLLSEHGLQASELRGTGQSGRITVEDILGHVAAGRSPSLSAGKIPVSMPQPSASRAETFGPTRHVPHTAIRKRIAEHMVQSLLHTAPHVTSVFEADMSAVLEHRRRHKDEFARRGVPLTLTAYFLEAAVAAIRAVPEANSRWTDTALEIFESMHIGVATALETGLVVPVLRDVQARDLFAIASALEELISRARSGQLAPGDVRGGTFTISNHGVSGSLVATPIVINQPQVAILGVGKLEKRAIVVSENGEDRLSIQPRCYVTLTIDHRAMDGYQANRFLQTFTQRLATFPM